VDIADPNCLGVIFAHGSRVGGYALFIATGSCTTCTSSSSRNKGSSRRNSSPASTRWGVRYIRENAGKYHELCTTKLYVNEKVVVGGQMRAQISSSGCRATASTSATTVATPSPRTTSRP